MTTDASVKRYRISDLGISPRVPNLTVHCREDGAVALEYFGRYSMVGGITLGRFLIFEGGYGADISMGQNGVFFDLKSSLDEGDMELVALSDPITSNFDGGEYPVLLSFLGGATAAMSEYVSKALENNEVAIGSKDSLDKLCTRAEAVMAGLHKVVMSRMAAYAADAPTKLLIDAESIPGLIDEAVASDIERTQRNKAFSEKYHRDEGIEIPNYPSVGVVYGDDSDCMTIYRNDAGAVAVEFKFKGSYTESTLAHLAVYAEGVTSDFSGEQSSGVPFSMDDPKNTGVILGVGEVGMINQWFESDTPEARLQYIGAVIGAMAEFITQDDFRIGELSDEEHNHMLSMLLAMDDVVRDLHAVVMDTARAHAELVFSSDPEFHHALNVGPTLVGMGPYAHRNLHDDGLIPSVSAHSAPKI